jgi:hypothetical protein
VSDALANFYALMRLPGQVDARAWRDAYAAIGRQPAQGAGPRVTDDEQYGRMTAAEKLDYARRFPQQPLDHGRRR